MKSKGKGQGFQCIKCGKKASKKIINPIPRKIQPKLYIPVVSAHRHLTRPIQRINHFNKAQKFDNTIDWCKNYKN